MRFVAKTAALFAATLSLCSVAQAEPLISAFIGTQTATSKTAYFVLDFNDPGPNPETYAFGWYYEGTKMADEFPTALAASLTGVNGFQEAHTDYPFGRLFDKLGYNGRAISSIDFPAGYWEFWIGFDGENWTSSNFGASATTLTEAPPEPAVPPSELQTASWTGWRWVPEFVFGVPTSAPRTPQAVVVPEPGTMGLLAAGLAGMALIGYRRSRRRRA